MDFIEKLFTWITGADGGAFLIVAWAMAWAAEKIPGWHKLDSAVKQLIVLGVSIALGIGVTALQQNPELVAVIKPYLTAVIYVIMAWLATQSAHEADPFIKRVDLAEKMPELRLDKMGKE